MSTYWEWDDIYSPRLMGRKVANLEMKIRAGGLRQPLLQSVREVIAPSLQRQFDTGGASSGQAWKPLKQVTVEKKARKGYARPSAPLVAKGSLRSAMGAQARWHVRDDAATFTGLPSYAEHGYYHQYGNSKLPARPFLRFSPGDDEKIKVIFDTWIATKVAEMSTVR